MDVILLERIERLGQIGDVVKVKPGFARNFLLPQKKALRATKDNIAYFESQRKVLEAQNLERRSEAEAAGGKMKDLRVTLIRQASEALQLYGSVTSRDIAEAAGAAGIKIERSQVVLERAIKALGLHKQRVTLHPEVSVTVTVNVAQSAEEAEMQRKGVDPLKLAMEAAAREAAEQAAATQPSADASESVAEVPVKG